MAEKYVIAFDLGTSSMKAILMDQNANIVVSEKRELHPCFPQEGWAESDPEACWRTVCAISNSMLHDSGVSPEAVCAVGFDAPSAGFIPVSREKGMLYPSIIWLDSRASGVANELNAELAAKTGEEGLRLWSGKDSIPKIVWFMRNQPEIWAKTDFFLSDTAYMVYKATGNAVISCQDAISYGVDFETLSWDYELFDAYGIDRSKLVKVVNASDTAGHLTEKAAQELGLTPGLPVTAGFSDCSAIEPAGGCYQPGDASLYIGTSMLFCMTNTDDSPSCATAYNFPSTNPDKKMYLLTNDMAGGCIDWIVQKLFAPDENALTMDACYRKVDKLLDTTPPGANRLFFSTQFCGERNPVCDDYVRAGFWNMNPDHNRADLLRAVYEGIGYETRWTLQEFEKSHGYHFDRLRVSGGGTRSEYLMQILADIMNVTLDVIEDAPNAVAKGTGYVALVAAGVLQFGDIGGLIRVSKTYTPRPEYRELYDRGTQLHQKYYETVKDFYQEVNGSL